MVKKSIICVLKNVITKNKKRRDDDDDDDSDEDYETDEDDYEIDEKEYTKFLSKLFPSKHIKEKVKKRQGK